MTNTIRDATEDARLYFVIGSNTTEQHPVIGIRMRKMIREKGTKLIVADPRRIELTHYATLHLQQRPGTDIALINGIMREIIVNGWEDADYIAERTEGYEAMREVVMKYTPELTEEITGVPPSRSRRRPAAAENRP